MRVLSYILLALLAIVIIVLAVANRHLVEVRAAPDFTAYGFDPSPTIDLPLFLVALAAGALGFVLGAGREYLRERKYRRLSRQRRRELGRMQHEIDELRAGRDEDDEVLAITAR